MIESLNKPRVFLSHSKHDIAFVQRVYDDLGHCQIDPWLDSEEIRHGQPWLDAIFQSGIPSCDSVLVYLTPVSIESPLVKKEIDASLITKLRDNHIAFLPYVSEPGLRLRLRTDLQALQIAEWNDANYYTVLPKVVAEIWRSFMERNIVSETSKEKIRRLEAELEIGRLKGEQGGVFSTGEDRDFKYIWDKLDRWEPATASVFPRDGGERDVLRNVKIEIHARSIVPLLADPWTTEFDSDSVPHLLVEKIGPAILKETERSEHNSIGFNEYPRLEDELMFFGLVERRERPQRSSEPLGHGLFGMYSGGLYARAYTPKMERLKYWLAYHELLPKKIEWRLASQKE